MNCCFISDTLQIGLGLAGFTILPWLLIVIGFGLFTVVSACMRVHLFNRVQAYCGAIILYKLLLP